MRIIRPVRWALLSFFVAACAAQAVWAAQAAKPLNQIIAIVNGEAVTALEVEDGVKRLLADGSPLTQQKARQRILKDLIDRRLMLQRAAQFGINISDAVVARRLAEFAGEFDLKDEADMRIFAQENHGLSLDNFRRRVREDLLIQALFYREVYLNTPVDEAQLEQFLRTETQIGVKREYRLGHIVIGTGDGARGRAEEARVRVASGEDFAAVAAALSDKAAEWDLGYKSGEELPNLFAAEAQNLKVGEVGQLIETPSAYHILKLLDARGGGLRDTVRRERLAHIFFPTTGGADAMVAARALRDEELTFAEAVREYSEDPESVDKEGDLGWFVEDETPPYFAAELIAMEDGDISAPVESPFGWHILQLVERRTDKFDIQVMRDRAARLLRERNAVARREVWLRNLRAAAYVRIVAPEFSPSL